MVTFWVIFLWFYGLIGAGVAISPCGDDALKSLGRSDAKWAKAAAGALWPVLLGLKIADG